MIILKIGKHNAETESKEVVSLPCLSLPLNSIFLFLFFKFQLTQYFENITNIYVTMVASNVRKHEGTKEKEGRKPLLELHKLDISYNIDPYKHDLQKPTQYQFQKQQN